ncbi:MAG: hypothetical protein PVH61_36505 [Candidatus Aminicenantes bacterium]|jgi:hypothetical protein
MKKQRFNVLARLIDPEELNTLNPGDEQEVDNSDNQAIYFLTIMLIMIVTFSIFKSEILGLIF